MSFPKADTAQEFLSHSSTSWSDCEGAMMTSTASDGRKQVWTLSGFAQTDDTVTMTQRHQPRQSPSSNFADYIASRDAQNNLPAAL